ncbi:MAG: type VI protein secretion system component VasK, partial [Planctomycetota bacterium]
ARKIRERLAELTQRLEVVFPVYLLFSKCDLLEGFVETFGGYGSKERAQLWGFTLPYLKSNDKSIAQQFDTEIDALQDRLGAERLHNLGAAKSKSKKAKIFSFPMQFAMVRERLRSFLTQLEQPNPYHESSDLRGFYFTSGTQEGQPLDQVLANMRAACGLTEDNESAVEEQTDKKAYFIDDLFTDVVFPDKELARSSAKAEKRGQLMRRIGMIATGAATLALLVLLVVGYVGQSSLIDRSMQAHEAANIDFTADELQRETTLAEDGGGPFEKLRVLFEELDDAHDSMGSYIIGQQNALYSRRVRKLYIKQLKTTLLAPLQARLKQQLEDGIKQSSEELNVILLKDVLTGYQMVGGKIAFDREWMKEFLLGDRWTWRKGEEILAGLAHRTTFLERVATATTTDWQVEAEEGLVRDSKMKWRKNSGVAKTVDKLRDESGETAPVPIDIMLTHPDANLVENSAVLECYVNETSLDSAFAKEAERNADETLDSLKERDRKDAIKAWRDSLFTLAPKQRLNLKEACERVRKLTSEPAGSFYVRYYELVSERLVRLGEDCSSPDDQAWLPDTLTAIGAVAEAAKPITNLTSTKRIIPSIGSNLDALTGKIAEARSTIGLRSKEAPVAIQSHIATALSNLLESVTTALAYEIVTQANQEWSQGVGKKLGTFSTQFPFTDSEEGVDPGEFQTMFADDGDFATALTEWVLPLEGYLGLLSLDREFDDHTLDRVKIDDIRKALFGVTVGCEIDFVLVKPNKTRSVTFQLGKQEPITAKRRTRKTLTWTPSDTVMIRINGFELAGPGTGVDSTKEELDTWGFLRLLSHGSRNPATFEMDSVEYQMCVWSDFKTNGESLTAGDTPASMTILFKTSAKPNPLNQDFFKHKFSHNKVFKNTEETDGK